MDQVWDRLKNEDNKDNFLQLVEVFWFIKETETLLYFKAQIESMKASTTEISNIKFELDSTNYLPPILVTLSQFKYREDNNFKIALGLIFEYLTKQSDAVPIVLRCIIDRFGFEFNSDLLDFRVQKILIETLWAKVGDGKNILFSKLFIAVAEKYLHTHFSQDKFEKRNSVRIIDFDLPANPLLIALRTTIWEHLFQLWQFESFQEDLWNLLYRHSINGSEVSVKSIIEQDMIVVLPFLEKIFDSSKFWHCCVGQKYLNLLSRLDITFEAGLKDRFQNDSYTLYKLMLPNREEERELEISYTEYKKIKNQRLQEVTRNYEFEDYTHFFEQCIEINMHLNYLEEYFFKEGVLTVFAALSERDSGLYEKVLMEYLNRQDFLNLGPYSLVEALIAKCGSRNSYDVLTILTYPSRRKWIFSFYQCLPPDEIKPEHIKQLYDLYCEAEVIDYPYDWDFLLNYQSLDKSIVARIAAIILDRAKVEPAQTSALDLLFNPNTEINKVIISIFSDDIDLLERLYIEADQAKTHLDHTGSTFSKILDIDPTFSDRYIEEIFKRKKFPSRHDTSRDYSFIWKREDFDKVMYRITQKVFELELKNLPFSYMQVFFGVDRKEPHDDQILEKQDRFIKRIIEEKSSDIEFMKFFFRTISYFAPERRKAHIAYFIKFNNKFEDFEKLSLEPNIWSWSGSAVPVLQEKIDYFESLAALFNTVDFLQHKLYIVQTIKEVREKIQREKKKDFTNELW